MKGRNGSTSFLPLNKEGGLIKDVSQEKYLTEDQTKYIYDKVELGDEIRVRKVNQKFGIIRCFCIKFQKKRGN